MSCNNNQDCGPNQHCADGQCIDDIQGAPLRRKTFKTLWSEYEGELKRETAHVQKYSDMMKDDLDEAAEARKEQAKKQKKAGWWTALATVVTAIATGGTSLLGTAIAGGVGYGVGSGVSDLLDDTEKMGLTDAELKAMDPTKLKWLKGAHKGVYDSAAEAQETLEEYDDNEWKQHVLGGVKTAWDIYKVGTAIESGLGLFAPEEAAEDLVEDVVTENTGWFDRTFRTLLDQMPGGDFFESNYEGGMSD